MDLSGVGVWSPYLRYGDRAEAADAAAELDQLGFRALWIPDAGGPVFDAAGDLLAATNRIVLATGVLNLWLHAPADVARSAAALAATHGDRFLLGLGVSHGPRADAVRPGRYHRPLRAMHTFLDDLDTARPSVPASARVLAALGPKMLDIAAKRARGAHTYLVPPEHTRLAREALGDKALVLPEQTAILCASADEARAIGTGWLRRYLGLPNYARNLLRLGFTEDDLASVSDRLFDALIAWGDEEAISRRVHEHRAAGADHVCLQLLTATPETFPREQWRRLASTL
ncbi:LLM class F420-dependent oxidoreductase [Prauserella endophytica]|uniref:LLM class F420-dependent oxidoreductase n=1 Tax=Prauserella endophytica TaxID=1592324 RepID=A0ABY2S519_9PSEU|nr:LLM class F420-dependent oxidoreductase [Prauserella endophytica]PXY33338.1 LLM class F420-dependent oxidoreductase [Prauserella coralliicola]TKG70917.1 LLM class F420-dependent oxidoreductase [Prauserella endophytica]